MKLQSSNSNTPNWKEITVKSRLPEKLQFLNELSHNLWWAWNPEARDLFKSLDPELWKSCGKNPVLMLERLSYERMVQLADDDEVIGRMVSVRDKFTKYMAVKPDTKRPSVAYFCMEYGLNACLHIYSSVPSYIPCDSPSWSSSRMPATQAEAKSTSPSGN